MDCGFYNRVGDVIMFLSQSPLHSRSFQSYLAFLKYSIFNQPMKVKDYWIDVILLLQCCSLSLLSICITTDLRPCIKAVVDDLPLQF